MHFEIRICVRRLNTASSNASAVFSGAICESMHLLLIQSRLAASDSLTAEAPRCAKSFGLGGRSLTSHTHGVSMSTGKNRMRSIRMT